MQRKKAGSRKSAHPVSVRVRLLTGLCALGVAAGALAAGSFAAQPTQPGQSITPPPQLTPPPPPEYPQDLPVRPPDNKEGDPGPSMTLGGEAPDFDDNTVILFNGRAWDGWKQRDGRPSQWEVQDDGSVLVKNGDAITERNFRDFQLHLEFRCPYMPEQAGQGRGNSGVYLHGRYEVQVLDSFGSEIGEGTCGAIYSIAKSLVNASRPPEEWQTYDIIFRAPRIDENGNVNESAHITVMHNGIIIHNNLELPHTTPGGIDRDVVSEGPILLQDHTDPVRYRNIWIREL